MRFSQTFDDLDEFVDTYRGSISREGMLLRLDHEVPEGTVLNIDISLASVYPLIKGTAGVVRVLPSESNSEPGHPIVLEFLHLHPDSSGFLDRLVAKFEEESSEEFRFYETVASPRRGFRRTRSAKPWQSGSFGHPPPERALSAEEGVTRSRGELGNTRSRRRIWLGVASSCAIIISVMAIVSGLVPQLSRFQVFSPESLVSDFMEILNPPAQAANSPAAIRSPQPVNARTPSIGLEPTAPFDGSPPATAIDRVGWEELADSTVVTVEANGRLDQIAIEHFLMTDDARTRLIVYLYGVDSGDVPYRQIVRDDRLEAIRVWCHDDQSPVQLHIVLDFARPDVVLTGPHVDGDELQVILSNHTANAQ